MEVIVNYGCDIVKCLGDFKKKTKREIENLTAMNVENIEIVAKGIPGQQIIPWLKAVEIVRKIVRVIDLNATNAANAFGALTATTATTNEQIIEQQVTIHAEFPNATNHSEIEEAFNNLINHATQFANRKK